MNDLYHTMRDLVFLLPPPCPENDRGTDDAGQIVRLLIEVGCGDGLLSLLVGREGSVRLLHTTESETLGLEERQTLRTEAEALIGLTHRLIEPGDPAKEIPLPETGASRITAVSAAGVFSVRAPVQDLLAGSHVLSQVFARSRELWAALWLLDQQREN